MFNININFLGSNDDLEAIELQWNKLTTLKYSEINSSPVLIEEKDTSEFWVDVLNLKDSGGQQQFTDLAEFIL